MNNSDCQLLSNIRSCFSSSQSPSSLAEFRKSITTSKNQEQPAQSEGLVLTILHFLTTAKYPIYIVRSERYQKKLCLKLYEHSRNTVSALFVNERRFSGLQHPNIIKIFE